MHSTAMIVRPAEPGEIDHLAKVWFGGWQDAHARIMPAELTRIRTLASFRDRIEAALPRVRVIRPVRAPVGFCILKGDELYNSTSRPRHAGLALPPRSRPTRRPGWRRPESRSAGSHEKRLA